MKTIVRQVEPRPSLARELAVATAVAVGWLALVTALVAAVAALR